MSRGYRAVEDPWRHKRCHTDGCLHLQSQHHGEVGECMWCGCAAFTAPTQDYLDAAAAEVAAYHEQHGKESAA